MDLNHLALQLTYVPDVLEVAGEHHHGEGTHQVILAEIKKGDSPIAFFDPQHLAANTSSFTYVFFGFPNSDAICDGNSGEEECTRSGLEGRTEPTQALIVKRAIRGATETARREMEIIPEMEKGSGASLRPAHAGRISRT